MSQQKIATVFGATGFLGSQIVRELTAAGYHVKAVTRVPERAYALKPCGSIGQVVAVACDYHDPKSIAAAIVGSDVVINTIGILYQKGKNSFKRVQTEIPTQIAKACKKHDVARFIQISSLGVDKAKSKYAKSKLAGEEAVKKAFPAVTIFRPSIMFGPEDSFFNMFAEMARALPALPLIGGGKTKMQPVYVGDVADAVMACLANAKSTAGQTYELGGPEVKSFKELMDILFGYTNQKKKLVRLPFCIAKIDAFFLSFLPKPPLTPDQVETLKTDNVVSEGALGLDSLGIVPTAMEQILPLYLDRFDPEGLYEGKRAA